ncbi:MAG: peptidylprolyl isomerase [Nitrospinae bacterium]|nr:peptidylprolyl isomerase [Nitrospinota bacterium]
MKTSSIKSIVSIAILFLLIFSFQNANAEKKNPFVTLETSKGEITIELYPKNAPVTVANFLKLIGRKFYDGLTFHRYEPNFVIQGGDPKGDGTGGPGYTVKDEHQNGLIHVKGAVAMARTMAPNSAGSQFYICLEKIPHLDNQYTVFGQVVQGMDVALQLRAGDTMKKVTAKEFE